MDQETKGFTIKDRRYLNKEEDINKIEEQKIDSINLKNEETIKEEVQTEKKLDSSLPPADFSSFILSLSHAAMMHLGHIPDPTTGKTDLNLEMARHTIDTIVILKDKTIGNLTHNEQRLIENILTELRLAFVRQTK